MKRRTFLLGALAAPIAAKLAPLAAAIPSTPAPLVASVHRAPFAFDLWQPGTVRCWPGMFVTKGLGICPFELGKSYTIEERTHANKEEEVTAQEDGSEGDDWEGEDINATIPFTPF